MPSKNTLVTTTEKMVKEVINEMETKPNVVVEICPATRRWAVQLLDWRQWYC